MRCPHCSEKLTAKTIYVRVPELGIVQKAGFACLTCKVVFDLAGNKVEVTSPRKLKDR